MTLGPGKYDEQCTWVREAFGAKAVVLIVAGGSRGQGFSVQGTLEYLVRLPEVLREVADYIERDMQGSSH